MYLWKMRLIFFQFSSVAQSCLTLCDHGLQHIRLPCPSPTPGPCSNSCPLSWWCHPTILSSVTPLLLVPSIFPSIRVFSNESVLPMSQFFASSGQSIAISGSALNIPTEYPGLVSFTIEWFDLFAVGGTQESSPTPQFTSIHSLVLSFL